MQAKEDNPGIEDIKSLDSEQKVDNGSEGLDISVNSIDSTKVDGHFAQKATTKRIIFITLLVALALTLLVTLVTGGMLIYSQVNRSIMENEKESLNNQRMSNLGDYGGVSGVDSGSNDLEHSFLNAKDTLSSVQDMINAKYSDSALIERISPEDDGGIAPYMSSGADYYVVAKESEYLSFESIPEENVISSLDDETLLAMSNDISDLLKANGFSSVIRKAELRDSTIYNLYNVYCAFIQNTFGCSDLADYQASIDEVAPLVAVLRGTELASSIPDSIVSLQDSYSSYTSDGYEHKDLYIDIASDLFPIVASMYREEGEEWKFFARMYDGMLSCDAYNTPEFREAYRGTGCFGDDGKKSIVQ